MRNRRRRQARAAAQLCAAAEKGPLEAIAAVLARGASVDSRAPTEAEAAGGADMLVGGDEEGGGYVGAPALTIALRANKREAALALLDAGADANVRDMTDGTTPLMAAAASHVISGMSDVLDKVVMTRDTATRHHVLCVQLRGIAPRYVASDSFARHHTPSYICVCVQLCVASHHERAASRLTCDESFAPTIVTAPASRALPSGGTGNNRAAPSPTVSRHLRVVVTVRVSCDGGGWRAHTPISLDAKLDCPPPTTRAPRAAVTTAADRARRARRRGDKRRRDGGARRGDVRPRRGY